VVSKELMVRLNACAIEQVYKSGNNFDLVTAFDIGGVGKT